MKSFTKITAALLALLVVFTSCEDTENGETGKVGNIYVVNYGSYSGAKTTFTSFDADAKETSQDAYKAANGGVELTSNVQYAAQVGDEIYLMGNNGDQIVAIDAATLVQSSNGVSQDIVKPRYCVSEGNYLYISCWGGDIWDDESLSYIAKFNKTTKAVEKKIELPGGPEGLALANGKLFAALNYKDSIAVMDLASDAISYIETEAVSSYFVKDENENLYVSFISTWNDFSESTGLGYINTKDATLDTTYVLDGVTSDYGSVLALDDDNNRIYVVAASYNANWQMEGGVRVFDIASKKFDDDALVSGIVGVSGVAVNPESSEVLVMVGPSTDAAGSIQVYNAAGDSITTQATGIGPKHAIFVK